jgi:glutaminase
MSAPYGGQFRVPNVSTGRLPDPDFVRALVTEAYNTFKHNDEGKNSTVYPAMERVQSDLFGICVVGTNGEAHEIGDTAHEFTIMSVSKPFVFALVAEALGVQDVRDKIGANAPPTGPPRELALTSIPGR